MYIPHILEPSLKGYEPPILSALEGTHFSVLGLLKAGNFGTAGQFVEAYSCVYTTHSRAITQRLRAPDPKCARGQAPLVLGLPRAGNFRHCINTRRNILL